jgi:two-component system, chemotaxis family, CheB/CheR fusion protein
MKIRLNTDAEAHANGMLYGLRILVVDDSAENAEALQYFVETEGGEARAATGAAEALLIAESEAFDLIISDISMPEINGYQLLRELRKRPHTASVPAIALTGYGRSEDAERTREAGYFAHMTKPVIFDQLLSMVLAAVRQCPK